MPLPLTVIPIPGPGAEDVLVTADGRVWTGTADGAIHVHHDEPELLQGAPRGRDARGEHGPEEGLAEQTGRRILDGGALAYGHHPGPSAAGEANEGRPSTICRM